MYLGGKAIATMSNNNSLITVESQTYVRKKCLHFLIKAAEQVHTRFPFHKLEELKMIEFMDPKLITKTELDSIIPVAMRFPNMITHNQLTDLDREWRFMNGLKDDLPLNTDIYEFWAEVSAMKRGDDSIMFPTLSMFIKKLLCLPHSSAAVERVFSAVNIIKRKDRNKLKSETVEGIFHTKRSLKDTTCYNFEIKNEHFKKFNAAMYVLKKKNVSD